MSINDISPASLLKEQQAHIKSQQLEPGEENHYRIWQNLASPYSYKVMTYMNYKGIPYKRVGTAEDMAAGAIYLASRAGDYVVGTTIPIDGGIVNAWVPEVFNDPSGH